MITELDRLVLSLDRKQKVDWLPEMKLGKQAYDHLLACLSSGEMNDNQSRNALHALFRLREHAPDHDLFSLLLEFVTNAEVKIRSEAVTLATGMIKLKQSGDSTRSMDLASVQNRISEAIQMGLDKPTAELAEEFVRQTEK